MVVLLRGMTVLQLENLSEIFAINDSSDDKHEINNQDIILNIRWALEGIMLPCIGVIGILGKLSEHH